jgi:hypothetical protein
MRQILTEEPSIEIVGEVPSFTAAIQMLADIKPEVSLLDWTCRKSATLRRISCGHSLEAFRTRWLYHFPMTLKTSSKWSRMVSRVS